MSERVNICVIVGNGYDMAAGLGTSTEAFVDSFAERHNGEDSPAGRLAAKIKQEGPESWADFERKLGEYAATVEESFSEVDGVAEFVNAKSAMEDDLAVFLKEREDLVEPDKVKDYSGECLASICNWLGALTPKDRKRFLGEFSSPYTFDLNFVTLNYTHVLDDMVDANNSNPNSISADYIEGYKLHECTHAHGDLAENPICGVDNPSQICSKKLADNAEVLETVVKSSTQSMLGSLDDEAAFDVIRTAEVVMVYGCSLGVTDSRWWKAVINRLKSSTTKRFVVLFSYGFKRSGCSAATVRERINSLKAQLFDSAGMSDEENKCQLFDRIFILPSDVIFKMPGAVIAGPPKYESSNIVKNS